MGRGVIGKSINWTPHTPKCDVPVPGIPSLPDSHSSSSSHVCIHRIPSEQIHFPGKCVSHTSSTYTFTTCRILHPSDQLTSVSPSQSIALCQSSASIGTPTCAPSSLPFSALPTPSYTPICTPRRLSLSLSLAESSTNLRDSTRTTSTSLGLVRLLQERGISASVYDPHTWDRGLDTSAASTPLGDGRPPETERGRSVKRPNSLLLMLPATPPNSPRSCSKAASLSDTRPIFQFSPCQEEPPYYEIFLASKPARTILREVLGETEKERGAQSDDESQTETLNLGLVDKLKRFRTLSPLSASSGSALLAPFGSNSTLSGGLSGLNAGLRRNRSYPALVGASMAMKDPGGTDILIPHTSHSTVSQDASKSHSVPPLVPPPARENVPKEKATRRKTRPKLQIQYSIDSDDET